MSIKLLVAKQKTAIYDPIPWRLTDYPFSAYRGDGDGYHVSLHVGHLYRPEFAGTSMGDLSQTFDVSSSRLMTTLQKKTLQIVPCDSNKDEKIMLITLRGGLDGTYSRIKAVGAEIVAQTVSYGGRCPTAHLIVRLRDSNGYVFAETGRRSGVGIVDFFSWDDCREFDTEAFKIYQTGYPVDETVHYSSVNALRERQRK
jgi:hypothetical protein